MIVNTIIVIAAFFFMEFVAWFTHKYIMHGPLWMLHKDHHSKGKGWFEMNDLFFIMFSAPSVTLIYFGFDHFDLRFWLGIGIALYGLFYFAFHDILVHRRFKIFRKPKSNYLKAMVRAHKVHHKHLGKGDGESFGFLIIHPKYLKKENNGSLLD